MNQDFIDFVLNNMSYEDRKELYSYISFFTPHLRNDFLNSFPDAKCSEWTPNELSDIVQPLAFYKKFGISLCSILNSSNWCDYLDSMIDQDYSNILKALGTFRTRKNELYVIRAGYRYGYPLVDDDIYDIILSLYTTAFEELSFFKEQAYDDDKYDQLIKDVLKTYGILSEYKITLDTELMASMDQEKSTSILPIDNYEAVFNFLSGTGFEKILFSLKIDGVNTKKGYKDGIYAAGLSRGRSSEGLDYTAALYRVSPQKISTTSHFTTVTSEAFVEQDYLDVLRNKYPDKKFKTSKSSAISLLRNPSNYDDEDLKHLKILSFDSDGLGVNKLEIYDNLVKHGFNVPPHIVIDKKDIPHNLPEFNIWLDNILESMHEKQLSLNLPSDGVVCEKIGLATETRKDQYSDSSIAIKFSFWAAQYYTSVVRNIILEQRRVNASIVLEIDPVVTCDGNVATRVNGGSLSLLISNGIKIDTEIKFMRKSSAYNVLVLEE